MTTKVRQVAPLQKKKNFFLGQYRVRADDGYYNIIYKDEKCLFCRIYQEKEPAQILYKDKDFAVFSDIRPASKHHFLVIPKTHIANAKSLSTKDIPLVESLVNHGKRILEERQGDINDVKFGFHWPPFNSISHLHLHVISPASQMSFLSKVIFQEGTLWFVTPQYVLQRLAKL